jgi:hypothetical protein
VALPSDVRHLARIHRRASVGAGGVRAGAGRQRRRARPISLKPWHTRPRARLPSLGCVDERLGPGPGPQERCMHRAELVTAEAGVEYDGRAALSDAMQMQAVTTDIQQLSRKWIALRVAAVIIAS